MFARSFDPLEGGILLSPRPALLYRTLRTTAKTICDFGRGRVSALPPDPSFPFARATDLVASVAAHSFGKRGGGRDGDFRGNISVTASIPRLLPPPFRPSPPLCAPRQKFSRLAAPPPPRPRSKRLQSQSQDPATKQEGESAVV